ncbi:hypothetical protein GCM10007320_34180 [Pseudorhodoferax aquiterrae]|uniref:Methyltransferase domain-containing protein n=1 Tax=Pseudorhodoferax aquiterrae TaxID=747304 RepID=A0ABQ3G3T8_9BURK|nr:glycosyltransferase family 2 protein [Pseudorhodoferax aquiterrae]GHC87688.1 hypothetical protein GCM10007320_34180 [Pseudorhodoferax aquiterrae]
MKMKLFLPDDYTVRRDNPLYGDVPGELVYQPDVYRLALYLAQRAGLRHVVDIGCGSAGKLLAFRGHCAVIGIDSEFGIDMARKTMPEGRWIVHDLEQPLPPLGDDVLRDAVVICSDVIEHLPQPAHLAGQLADLARRAPYVLVSTPDRDRARGWLDRGPPANPAHALEWNASEFVRFLREAGFGDVPFHGHTINTDHHRAKSTLIALAGIHVSPRPCPPCKLAAVMHGFNEVDILPEVLDHLAAQGVEVHYFDNWSTDGSWELAQERLHRGQIAHCARFPEAPTDQYEWHAQLSHTTSYAQTLDATWVMHHDADEIRTSPWPGVSLRDAVAFIDALGYNAIDFTVLDFRFVDGRAQITAHYERDLNHFEFGRRPGHFRQIKCWRNDAPAELADSGGHDVQLPGRKVYPVKFLLKHYPLRNEEQALRKIHHHRLPRFTTEQQKYQWHHQYDAYKTVERVTGWKYKDLLPWHAVHFNTEYLVERISGIGLD